MMDFTDITGLFSTVIFLTTLASLIFPIRHHSRPNRCLILVVLIVLLVFPVGPVSASAYVRSFVGDLSITSLVVLSLTFLGAAFALNPLERKKIDEFCLQLLPPALLFYPLALGLGRYDPYALGYGSPYFLGIVFLVTLLAWATAQWLISVSLSLSVFCYAIGWYESNNLWDYLIDPLLAVYALCVLINRSLLWINFRFRIEATFNK